MTAQRENALLYKLCVVVARDQGFTKLGLLGSGMGSSHNLQHGTTVLVVSYAPEMFAGMFVVLTESGRLGWLFENELISLQ